MSVYYRLQKESEPHAGCSVWALPPVSSFIPYFNAMNLFSQHCHYKRSHRCWRCEKVMLLATKLGNHSCARQVGQTEPSLQAGLRRSHCIPCKHRLAPFVLIRSSQTSKQPVFCKEQRILPCPVSWHTCPRAVTETFAQSPQRGIVLSARVGKLLNMLQRTRERLKRWGQRRHRSKMEWLARRETENTRWILYWSTISLKKNNKPTEKATHSNADFKSVSFQSGCEGRWDVWYGQYVFILEAAWFSLLLVDFIPAKGYQLRRETHSCGLCIN